MSDEFVTIKLRKRLVCHMLYDFIIRYEIWDRFKDYLDNGVIYPEDFYLEENSDENEEEQIANYFLEIIKEIETHLEDQST